MLNRKFLKIHPQQGKHIPSDFLMSTISSLKTIENSYDIKRGKDCMKKFCESLGEHTMEKWSY